jgi:hypothetical protein
MTASMRWYDPRRNVLTRFLLKTAFLFLTATALRWVLHP